MNVESRLLRRASLGVFAGLLTLAVSAGAQAQTTSYSFRCRGGADSYMQVKGTTVVYTYGFVKANPGSWVTPAEGACRWKDRTVSNNEPSQFQMVATNEAERALLDKLDRCLTDPNCAVGMHASNGGTFLQPDLTKHMWFSRMP